MKSIYKDVINDESIKKSLTKEELSELHDCLINMFKEISEVCKTNEIKPFLIYGNLLGKIRHDGFIPWDDDVDIGLLREDYERFVKIFDASLSDKYVISTPNGKHKAYYRFVQVGRKGTKRIRDEGSEYDEEDPTSHCFIDIMPFDYAPDNPVWRRLKAFRCEMLMAIAGCVAFTYSSEIAEVFKRTRKGRIEFFCRMIMKKIFGFRSAEQWYRALDKAIRYRPSNHLVCALGKDYYSGAIYDINAIIPLQASEYLGVSVFLPNNPDTVLSQDYGNYLELPPEEKRQCHSATKTIIDKGLFNNTGR